MNRWVLLGALLAGVAIVPAVQQVREYAFREIGTWRYDEVQLTGNPIVTASHILNVEDELPEPDAAPSQIEREAWARTRVTLDGAALLPEALTRVQPGRSRSDLARYQLWITARRFTDRSDAETVWLGRRVQASSTDPPLFEVIVLEADGEVFVDSLTKEDRSRSYRHFRMIQFLEPTILPVYRYSMANVWPGLIVPFLYPWATFLAGLLFLAMGRARRRRART